MHRIHLYKELSGKREEREGGKRQRERERWRNEVEREREECILS